MKNNQVQGKGILAKLLETGVKILLKKECKNIGRLEIDIIASSKQIIKGMIQNIQIIAEEINYKDLILDEVELEAKDVKITFKSNDRELKLRDNFIIKFKITLSENSIRNILLSNKWNWIKALISQEILNQQKLEDIKIRNGQILIKSTKDNRNINEEEKFDIKVSNGKLFLESENYNKSMKIPIEDKVFIKNLNIQNNLIYVFAESPVSF